MASTTTKLYQLKLKNGLFNHLKKLGYTVDNKIVSSCEKELSLFAYNTDKRFNKYLGYPNAICGSFLPTEVMDHLLLNIGDWRGNKYLGPNTHGYEFEAIKYLKEIFEFPAYANDWGNSCTGSSEAVLAAVVYARTFLSGKTQKKPVVITTKEAHYCHKKCAFIAGLECIVVKTDEMAGMDLIDFKSCLSKLWGTPVIVLATCGTTVREGYDPIQDIANLASAHRAGSYVHIDAALCGFTAPFLDEVEHGRKPLFHPGVSSISVSLHKAGACNRPSALVLGIDRSTASSPIQQRVEYIDAADGTPSGSRNGHPVLAFAMMYRIIGREGFKIMAEDCLAKAEYLTAKLRAEGIQVFHNEGALTVFVPCPSDQIVSKYTLACADRGAHIITMQHVTTELLDEFIAEYVDWYWANYNP